MYTQKERTMVVVMTEKRFTINVHRIYDNNEEIACADTLDDAEILVDLLNEQEETINELKQRNQRQYERLKQLTDLMQKRDWKTLEQIADGWEKQEELLQAEYGSYGDNV